MTYRMLGGPEVERRVCISLRGEDKVENGETKDAEKQDDEDKEKEEDDNEAGTGLGYGAGGNQ